MIFIKGLLFGLTLQLAIGPVCFAAIIRSVTKGFWEAFKMSLGVALVDAMYIVLSIFGMASLLQIDAVHSAVVIIGGIIIIYFGLMHIVSIQSIEDSNSTFEESISAYDNQNSFWYGVKLTIPNTVTILLWTNVFGVLIATQNLSGIPSMLLYGLGCATSTVVFFSFVCGLGNYFSRFFNAKVKKYLNILVGIFLIFFGLRMLFV